ncbi:MAG TPA: tRNA pseudouridine(55) synthase TruB [Clostridia bacterium]|nr:tRNA pseudouridine(55) synthase TruB [Clostridia bacterium]
MNSKQSGLIFLNKPTGITSFQALNAIKKSLGHGKIGHTGTLDKFAEGLLIVLAGKNTRLVPYFEGLDKTYLADIRFGATTETLDTESPEVEHTVVPNITHIEARLKDFHGEQEQIPPQYSAVHVDGKRAYQRTLQGEHVEIPSRKIIFYSIEVLGWTEPVLSVRIHCSKGTYIRAFARDLGIACGSKAYLEGLQRTRIGHFDVSKAIDPKEFKPEKHLQSATPALLQLPGITEVMVEEESISKVLNGNPIQPEWLSIHEIPDGIYALVSSQGELCALTELSDNNWKYRYVAERN